MVVDIGGGQGLLIEQIRRANPSTEGVVFDRPDVVERARQRVAGSAIGDRLRAVGGDALADVPGGGDVYLLARVLHKWRDDDCVRILRNCQRAMSGRGRLIVVERVMPDRTEPPDDSVFMDLGMMVCFGAWERTESDYRALFARSGFTVQRIIPTEMPV